MKRLHLFLIALPLFLLCLPLNHAFCQTHSAYVFYMRGDTLEVPIDSAEVTFLFRSGTGSGTFYTNSNGMCYTTHVCGDSIGCRLRVSVFATGFDPLHPASGEYQTHCDQMNYFPFEMTPSDGAFINPNKTKSCFNPFSPVKKE